jgi:U4/U6 small nuclear ribonucleoprotein PRP4
MQHTQMRSRIVESTITLPKNFNLSNTRLTPEEEKEREEVAEMFKRKQIAKTIIIPISDPEVKQKLREFEKPICLFGEKQVDRRERLRKEIEDIVIEKGEIPEILTYTKKTGKQDEKIEDNEVFYTEGIPELKACRMEMAKYSIPRSAFRIELAKKKFMEIDRIQEGLEYESFLQKHKNYEYISSQFADERGCSRGKLSPDDKYYAVAGVSGVCTVFDVPNLNKVTYLKGHTDKINCVTFNPGFLKDIPKKGPNIATCSNDNLIKIWSFDPSLENQLNISLKHEDRVNMVEFHPMGRYLASTSHDKTWRLWDIETKKEILLQEGHSAPVFPINFQKDGALVATGDLAGIGLLWDLRSGRCVMSLQGHVKQMISLKFSGNSYQLATGSDDNTLRIWDLRRKVTTHVIPAHNSTISDIEYEHNDSKFVLTCSYDSTFKIWNNRDWSIVKTFSSTSDGKLTSIALTKDNKNILTTSLDRTVKLWSLNDKTYSE